MASRIESESPSKALRRQAESNAAASASSKPTVPGSPPKPVPKRAALPSAIGQPETAAAEDREAPARRGFFGQIPAWGISVIVHVIALLLMALMAGERVRIEKPTLITSSVSEAEEAIADLELEQPVPDEVLEVTDPVEVTMPEMAITPEVTVDAVVPVEVVTSAIDTDAAPLAAIDAFDFGADLPMQAGSAAEGGPGGMSGGLGGRGKPGQMAAKRGGGADTEEAVDRALKWIAAHQLPDGGWDFDLQTCPSCAGRCLGPGKNKDRGSATALALLPFLGRGYTHLEGPYQKEVGAGIGFLVRLATAGDGQVYKKGSGQHIGGSLYGQGLAGIALTECYAMSRDGTLAAPTQSVLDFIMAAQDPVGGGWRYYPKMPGDTSVLSWQIMALKSGSMAGLQINPLTIKKAEEFLDSVQADEQGATYKYDVVTDPKVNPARSAAGLLCRMYLGWKKDHPGIQQGADIISNLVPTDDLYYDYYATQIMHHMEGDMWIAWNAKMKGLLLASQSTKGHEAGSWFEPFTTGHGPVAGGRLYCTALATMILEVYYRHLPLYSTQSVQEKFRD